MSGSRWKEPTKPKIAGPWKDHLVGRGGVTGRPISCLTIRKKMATFSASKSAGLRWRENKGGHYIKKLHHAGVENMVKLLAFSPEKAGEGNNAQLGSKELKPLKCSRNYNYRLLNQTSTLSRENELSEHCQGTSATPDVNQTPRSAGREDREFRLTAAAWVEQVFDKAYANHLFGLSSGFSSNEPLLTTLSLWRKSFMILDGVN